MTTRIFHEIKTTLELGLKSVSLRKSLRFPLNGEASRSHSRVPCFQFTGTLARQHPRGGVESSPPLPDLLWGRQMETTSWVD